MRDYPNEQPIRFHRSVGPPVAPNAIGQIVATVDIARKVIVALENLPRYGEQKRED